MGETFTPTTWLGSIENCLYSGEYDQGDLVTIDYDELADLVEQGKWAMDIVLGKSATPLHSPQHAMEMRTNRPLHPSLGGESPYSQYLRG
jgi:hypothetical protein